MAGLEDINSALKERDATRKQLDEQQAQLADIVFQSLFDEFDNLHQLELIGWTMGFNDGDPCYHQMAVFIDPEDLIDYGLENEEDYDEDGHYIGGSNCSLESNKNLSEEDSKTIYKTLDKLESALEQKYGTNWQLTVTRNSDGSVNINKDWYDCGY